MFVCVIPYSSSRLLTDSLSTLLHLSPFFSYSLSRITPILHSHSYDVPSPSFLSTSSPFSPSLPLSLLLTPSLPPSLPPSLSHSFSLLYSTPLPPFNTGVLMVDYTTETRILFLIENCQTLLRSFHAIGIGDNYQEYSHR